MKKLIFAFIISTVATMHFAIAQTDDSSQKKQAIKASVGYGISVPYDDSVDFNGQGFFAQAEYVYTIKEWFDIRPYAGFIFTSSNENAVNAFQRSYTADMSAFLLGGKVRLKAPIPWVAPFVEVGGGMSVGTFETITNDTDRKESGLLFHIPVSLGLAIGRNHKIEIAFTYFYHNAINQFAGAATVGITFPLNKPLFKRSKRKNSRMF